MVSSFSDARILMKMLTLPLIPVVWLGEFIHGDAADLDTALLQMPLLIEDLVWLL